MALAIGGNSINKAYLGSTEIQKMYLGSELVYSGEPEPLQIPTGIQLELIEVDIDLYVSATGSGTEDGLTEENSMGYTDARTAISTMQAGETMAFKRGEVFKHTTFLDIDVSGAVGNPITFTAYGSGTRAQIDSTDIYTGTWTNQGSNIWTSEASAYNESNPRLKINGNEVLGTKIQAELGTLIPDRVVFWNDDTTDTIHLYSTTDPSLDEVMYMRGSRAVYAQLQDNLVFDGLEFIGGYYGALMLAGANNIEVKNCKMGDMCASGVNITDSGVTTCSNITVHDNDMNSSFPFDYRGGTVDDSETTERGSSDGVKVGQCFGGSIYNNTFFDWGHTGVSLTAGSSGEVVNNFTVYDNTFSLSALRDYGGGFTIDRDSSGHEVYNNTMTGCKSNQINGHGNHFHHNDIINTRQTALYTYEEGFGVDMATYAGDVYGNIIEFNNITNAESGAIRLRTSGTRNSGHRIRNNVTENCGSQNNNISVELNYGTTGIYDVNFDDNNFYNATETLIYLDADTGDYEDIAFLNASTKYGINANNVNQNPVQPTGSTPVLSNFRIESAEPTRVYFSTPLGYPDGMTITGFVISNRAISGVTKVDDNGGYFEVDVPFTFWDNNTIRLGETNTSADVQTVLHNFTFEYIENNIPEPTATTNRYVNADATGGGDGLSDGTAWTWAEGMSNATDGMTVWVKAGSYTQSGVNYMSGSTDPLNPAKVIGYKVTTGDITENYYTYTEGVTLPLFDPIEQPVIDSQGNTSNYPFLSQDSNNWILKNISFYDAYKPIHMFNNRNFGATGQGYNQIVENCNTQKTVAGIQCLTWQETDGVTDHFHKTSVRIKGCISLNADATLIQVQGDGNLIEGCKTYTDNAGDEADTDYYISFNGSNNMVRNSTAYKDYIPVSHPGHGIGVRGGETGYTDWGVLNQYNLIEGCEASNIRQSFYVRNKNTNYNVIRGNIVNGQYPSATSPATTGGLGLLEDVRYNVFENNQINNVAVCINWYQYTESGATVDNYADSNIFRNNVFNQYELLFYQYIGADPVYSGTAYFTNNKILNNSFIGGNNGIQRTAQTNYSYSGNIMQNNIFDGLTNADYNTSELRFEDAFTFTNDNFFDCGADFYSAPYIGTDGNIDLNPNFVDQVDFVPQEETMVKPTIEGIYYSYNNKERNNTNTTMGAVLLLSENNN